MCEVKERRILKNIKNLKSANLYKAYRKIYSELESDPLVRTHHFELLENQTPKPSLYSKRISQDNRIVYSVDRKNRQVIIYNAWC